MEIEIYTQPWCPYSGRAVSLLRRKSVAFREIDTRHGTPEREESSRRSGRTTVPQIFIDGRHIGDCDELVVLGGAGKLGPLLKAGSCNDPDVSPPSVNPVISSAAKACPCEGEDNRARISCERTLEIASLRSQ